MSLRMSIEMSLETSLGMPREMSIVFPLAWSNPFFFVVEVSLGVSPRMFSWNSLGVTFVMLFEMS